MRDGPPTVYVALGGNLDGPLDHMRRAVAAFRRRFGDLRTAAVYRSDPEGGADQPEYLNTVVRLRTTEPAPSVLAFGRVLEERAGRRPGPSGAARPLDVDLLFHGDLVCATSDLTVPHPRWAGRPFVVVPLLDLDPDWTDPASKRTVAEVAEAHGWDGSSLERVLPAGVLESGAAVGPSAGRASSEGTASC